MTSFIISNNSSTYIEILFIDIKQKLQLKISLLQICHESKIIYVVNILKKTGSFINL